MRIFLRILLGLFLLIIVAAVALTVTARHQRESEAAYHQNLPKTIRLETGKMSRDSLLAQECTCKGGERSPDLYWNASVPDVKSFALIVTDPDAPSPAFQLFNVTHWLVYDIPAAFTNLPEGLPVNEAVKRGAQFGKNMMGDLKYIGPCPPMGRHAYVFKIYALDKRLEPTTPLERQPLLDAMKGHILAYGELKGYYAAD